jgi:hypothetical protein
MTKRQFARDWATTVLGVLITVLISVLREAFAPLFASTGKTVDQVERVANHITTKKETIHIKAEPPAYSDGDPDKVQAFLREMHMYYSLVRESNPGRTVVFALSRIKGGKENSATKWADAKRQSICQYEESIQGKTAIQIAEQNLINPMPRWVEFKKQFIQHFMLRNKNEMARDTLDNLNMKDKTCEEYTTIFNGYAEIAQYDNVFLLRNY